MSLFLTLNFRDGTMMINDEIINALGRPGQVQILINEEAKQLLLRTCELQSNQAVLLDESLETPVEIPGRSLLKKISKIANWEDNQPRICPGEYLPDISAVGFDLTRAFEVIVGEPMVN